MAKEADYISDDATGEVRIVVARLCAGGCDTPIYYQLHIEAGLSRYAPSVCVIGHRRAFAGGHLCKACDERVSDALRDDKMPGDRIG